MKDTGNYKQANNRTAEYRALVDVYVFKQEMVPSGNRRTLETDQWGLGGGGQGRGADANEVAHLGVFRGTDGRAGLEEAVAVWGAPVCLGWLAHRTLCTECRESSCRFLPWPSKSLWPQVTATGLMGRSQDLNSKTRSTQCHMILSVYLPELRGSGPCWLSPALAIVVRAARLCPSSISSASSWPLQYCPAPQDSTSSCVI